MDLTKVFVKQYFERRKSVKMNLLDEIKVGKRVVARIWLREKIKGL